MQNLVLTFHLFKRFYYFKLLQKLRSLFLSYLRLSINISLIRLFFYSQKFVWLCQNSSMNHLILLLCESHYWLPHKSRGIWDNFLKNPGKVLESVKEMTWKIRENTGVQNAFFLWPRCKYVSERGLSTDSCSRTLFTWPSSLSKE